MTRTNTDFPSNVKTWISALANLSSSCGTGTASSFFFTENIYAESLCVLFRLRNRNFEY